MPQYLYHNETTISRTVSFSYFLFAALSGAGFQLGMLGVRKFANSISESKVYDADYWKSLIQNSLREFQQYMLNQGRIDDDDMQSKDDIKSSKIEEVSIQQKTEKNTGNAQTPERRDRNESIGSYASLTNQQSVSSTHNPEKRYLELLVHNVAHTDLVLSLGDKRKSSLKQENTASSEDIVHSDDSDDETPVDLTLCKPRFSAFSLFSNRVFTALLDKSKESKLSSISFPRYERRDTPRYTLVTPRPSRQIATPVGFNLTSPFYRKQLNVNTNDLTSLRIRGRDYSKISELDDIMKLHQEALEKERETNDGARASSRVQLNSKSFEKETQYHLNAIFFPLLATLMARWEDSMKEKYSSAHNVKKVIFLVTGVGTPRNWTHSVAGNSTKSCAEVMELFLNILYPDVTVVKIHSETNIFRYDDNILFTTQELVPMIDGFRDAHARNLPYPDELKQNPDLLDTKEKEKQYYPFDPDWKKTFHVTLSFADGAPARTHAIQAALRAYRPTYFHIWQLKTFWHETKITSDDIEVHAFEEMETAPPVDIEDATDKVQVVSNEMLKFKAEYVQQILNNENDIDKFWLRKTKKPVLAVLAVRKQDTGEIVLYRGTNMEVSMPTGSLCAERNVIGTALATNPGLKREDLLMVAVLAIPFEDIHQRLLQLVSYNVAESDRIIVEKSRDHIRRSMSVNSFASVVEEDPLSDEDEDWIQTISDVEKSTPKVEDISNEGYDLSESIVKIPPLNLEQPANIPPTTPLRRIRIYSNKRVDSDGVNTYCIPVGKENVHARKPLSPTRRRGKRKTVVVHSHTDMNPLRPCGACNEWLKKIAESNPYFKVLTFTDADCKGVYVNSCQE